MNNVTIISDGTSQGTRIKIDDAFMKGITKIVIEPMVPGETVRATITLDAVSLRMAISEADIECTDILAEEKIRMALLDFNPITKDE